MVKTQLTVQVHSVFDNIHAQKDTTDIHSPSTKF